MTDPSGMVQVDVVYEGDLHCRLTHVPSGGVMVTDAPVDNEGKGEAFAPTDLLAASLGSCIITIMGIYARRKGIDIKGSTVRVRKWMIADPLRRVARMEVVVDLPARIEPKDRPPLEKAGHCCPVEQSLHPKTQVDLIFRYSL